MPNIGAADIGADEFYQPNPTPTPSLTPSPSDTEPVPTLIPSETPAPSLTESPIPTESQSPTPSLTPLTPAPGDYFVDGTNGADTTNGGTQERPWKTIYYAYSHIVGTMRQPCRIFIAEGLYQENIVMDDYESMYGGCNPVTWAQDSSTTVSGAGPGYGPVVAMLNHCVLDRCDITNGAAPIGAGAYVSPAVTESAVISNCTFFNNYCWEADNGSAIGIVSDGKVNIVNCIMRGNYGPVDSQEKPVNGSVVYIGKGKVTLKGCVIRDNPGSSGIHISAETTATLVDTSFCRNGESGLELAGGSFEATNCQFARNFFHGLILSGNAVINNSQILYNGGMDAGVGGGIYADSNADITIKRSVIAYNTAKDNAGGILTLAKKFKMTESAIIGNFDLSTPSGPWRGCDFQGADFTILQNNIFLENDSTTFNAGGGGGLPKSCNNTILRNMNGYVVYGAGSGSDLPILRNDLFWENYTDLSAPTTGISLSYLDIQDGTCREFPGVIHVVPGLRGTRYNGTATYVLFDRNRYRSTIIDETAEFEIDSMKNAFLYPSIYANYLGYFIESNTKNSITPHRRCDE